MSYEKALIEAFDNIHNKSDRVNIIEWIGKNADRHVEKLQKEIAELKARLEQMDIALTPRRWSVAHNDAWHRNIPDTVKAFEMLKNVGVSNDKTN